MNTLNENDYYVKSGNGIVVKLQKSIYVISFFWIKCYMLRNMETCEHARRENKTTFQTLISR